MIVLLFYIRPEPEPEPEPRKPESPISAPQEEAITPSEAKKAEESVVQAEGMIPFFVDKWKKVYMVSSFRLSVLCLVLELYLLTGSGLL